MSESILVTGKRISDMELLANLSGSEKIPTGTANDNAVTPEMIRDYTIQSGDLINKSGLDNVKSDLQSEIDATNSSLSELSLEVNSSKDDLLTRINQERQERVTADNQTNTKVDQLNLDLSADIQDLGARVDQELSGKVDKEGSVTTVVGLVGDITDTDISDALSLGDLATKNESDIMKSDKLALTTTFGYQNQDELNRVLVKSYEGYAELENASGFEGLTVFLSGSGISGSFTYTESTQPYTDRATVVKSLVGTGSWVRSVSSSVQYSWFSPPSGSVDHSNQIFMANRSAYALSLPLDVTGYSIYLTSDVNISVKLIADKLTSISGYIIGDGLLTSISFSRSQDFYFIVFKDIIVEASNIESNSLILPFSFRNCTFRNARLTIGRSGNLTQGYLIQGCSFNLTTSRVVPNLKIVDASSVSILGSKFSEGSACIEVAPTRSYACNSITIDNCVLGSWGSYGIYLRGKSMFRVSSVEISNCTLAGSSRNSPALPYSALRADFVSGLKVSNRTRITDLRPNILLQSCDRVTIDDCDIQQGSAVTSSVIIGTSSNVSVTNNRFLRHAESGAYFVIVSGVGALNYVSGSYENPKDVNVIGNTFKNLNGTRFIKYDFVTGGMIANNNLITNKQLDVVAPIWLPNTNSYVGIDNNTFTHAESIGKVTVNDLQVNKTVVGQSNIVNIQTDSSVSVPIITESDNLLSGARSYVVEFTVGNISNLHQIIDGADNKSHKMSEWVTLTPETPKLAWNSCAWNTTTKKIPDIVVDGIPFDSYGGATNWWSTGAVFIDNYGRLSCRDFTSRDSVTVDNTYNPEVYQGIREVQVAENAYITSQFRAPLVVDGVLYDPVSTNMIADNAFNTELSARTTIGQKADGTFILVTCDGVSGVSGCTMRQMADKHLALGSVNAFNLDGGGSSTLWYNGETINRPSDAGGERSIPVIMYLV